jgi:glucose/arabinose dehydrogenase
MVKAFGTGFASLVLLTSPTHAASPFDSWRQDSPGVERMVNARDIPPAKRGTGRESADLNNGPGFAPRGDRLPQVPAGFSVQLYASGLKQPRVLRVAPNGDVFLAESQGGRILVFQAADGVGRTATPHVFADGLDRPYGIAFYPLGPDPQWVYVGLPDKIIRYPYHIGDLAAAGPAQVIVPDVPSTHHWTRDVVVAADGRSLFYSVGSGSNDGGDMKPLAGERLKSFIAGHALGEAWGPELGRAEVRNFDPDGKWVRPYAEGLRNCSGMTVQPGTGALWCVVNERDALGDNTPPDYATTVAAGAFYGWPWFYIGDHPDPRWAARSDLKDRVTPPDVLLQAHTAPLGIAFYTGQQFPADYRGDAFVTLHGSWDRTVRAGYKVVRLRMAAGKPTGVLQDFMTGFVVDDNTVWGRPVGIATAQDGALLVSDDGSGSIWRVTASGGR